LRHYRLVPRMTIEFEGDDLELVERACRNLAEMARRDAEGCKGCSRSTVWRPRATAPGIRAFALPWLGKRFWARSLHDDFTRVPSTRVPRSAGRVANVVPVDAAVPGCPPHPNRILVGILTAIRGPHRR